MNYAAVQPPPPTTRHHSHMPKFVIFISAFSLSLPLRPSLSLFSFIPNNPDYVQHCHYPRTALFFSIYLPRGRWWWWSRLYDCLALLNSGSLGQHTTPPLANTILGLI